MSERLASSYRKLSYTPEHVKLMLKLNQAGIPYLSEHHIETDLVRDNGFAKQFIADIYIEPKIVIEVDGKVHTRATRARKDAIKTDWLTSHGYTVLRFTNSRINRDLAKVVEEIKEARTRMNLR